MPELISKTELEQTQKEAQQILIQLESVESQGWVKKGDLIKSYIEKNRILRDAGVLEITGYFSSYIREKLKERNISVSQNERFTNLFTPDEKDPRGQDLDSMSNNISSGLTVDQTFKDKKEIIPQREDEYTVFFDVISKCIEEASSLNSAMKEEYQKDEITLYPSKDKKIIKSDVHWKTIQENINIETLTPEFLGIHATLRLARDNLDERNEWGNYQKLILQFLIRIGETKAQAAKMSNYCSKYASLGIERSEKVKKYWDYLRKCPKCKADIAHECNYQIQLIESGQELSIETPLDGY